MGIHVIKMPDIGEGIAEVEVVAWHVKPGDEVAEDQLLAEVMTDKATVEVPSPVIGKVLALGGEVGEVMAVGGELVRIEVAGAGNVKAATPKTVSTTASPPASHPTAAQPGPPSAQPGPPSAAPHASPPPSSSAPLSSSAPASPAHSASRSADVAPNDGSADSEARKAASAQTSPRAATASSNQPSKPSGQPRDSSLTRSPGEKPLASPAVRRHAWDLGIELQFVQGSGAAGLILHEDLDDYLLAREAGSPVATRRSARSEARDSEEAIPVIGLRRKIAQKMQEAKRRIPHYSYVEEVDVTELEALRARLNQRWGDSRGKLTVLPLLLRALVMAIQDHPQVNARFDDEGGVVTRHSAVHAGIATQTPGGLMVPVVHHAQTHDLWSAAAEIARLADAARAGKAAREELSGSTITITSLGALGGIVTTPVINHPEVAIVGVNRIVERPVVRDGRVVIRKIMNLSSSFDHRVVDGMDAAEFVQAIRGVLECPALLFVE